MLGSITPLGERGRGSRWWLTATAYVAGSVAGAVAFGGTFGAFGGTLVPIGPPGRLALLGAALLVGLAFDLRAFGLRLPTVHRQVDEGWRSRYRGWVWGAGFGFQLGVGVVTIVTTSTVYVTWLAATLSGSLAAGASVGFVFGLARALPVFAVARVRSPIQLFGVDASLTRMAAPARRATYVAGVVAAVMSFVGAARW